MSELADILERFRRGPELVAVATTGAAGSELDFQPGEGKWSVRQIVCHLADYEMIAGMRFRQMLAEENPSLPYADQDLFATKLDYAKRKVSTALETFRRIRMDNYELLKDLPEEAFNRTGNHSKRGIITLRDMLRIMAEHPEKHVGQIQRTRAAFKENKAKQAAS
ncbi:MAG: DinB family protein [Bryobacteraceae bacterium]